MGKSQARIYACRSGVCLTVAFKKFPKQGGDAYHRSARRKSSVRLSISHAAMYRDFLAWLDGSHQRFKIGGAVDQVSDTSG